MNSPHPTLNRLRSRCYSGLPACSCPCERRNYRFITNAILWRYRWIVGGVAEGPDDPLEEIRARVAAGNAANVSAFVKYAVGVALHDAPDGARGFTEPSTIEFSRRGLGNKIRGVNQPASYSERSVSISAPSLANAASTIRHAGSASRQQLKRRNLESSKQIPESVLGPLVRALRQTATAPEKLSRLRRPAELIRATGTWRERARDVIARDCRLCRSQPLAVL